MTAARKQQPPVDFGGGGGGYFGVSVLDVVCLEAGPHRTVLVTDDGIDVVGCDWRELAWSETDS